jgi:diacylglycerol kinase (ATP)
LLWLAGAREGPTMSRRVKLIFNPHAKRGSAYQEAHTLQAIVRRYGEAEWASTEHPMHAADLAEEAAKQGFDVVVALGGDGTANEVINGIMRLPEGRRPLMAAVPVGSGNDFASNMGVAKDPEVAMQRVFTGEPRQVDLGEVIDQAGRARYFGNILGIGFDAWVTIYSYHSEHLKGFAMYLWCVLQAIARNNAAPAFEVRTDSETFHESALMFCICNGAREGGGFFVAPEARPDDGIFHYMLIRQVSQLMMLRLLPEVMKGTHGRFHQVRMGKLTEVELKSDRPLAIHLDGEITAGFQSDVTGLRVRILPGALRMIT